VNLKDGWVRWDGKDWSDSCCCLFQNSILSSHSLGTTEENREKLPRRSLLVGWISSICYETASLFLRPSPSKKIKKNTQDDRKVTTHSWRVFHFSKHKLQWNQKTKTLSVGNIFHVRRCTHSPSSSCLMQLSEQFPCDRNGSPHEIMSVWHKRIGKCNPKLILAC
jgi:hypothetical protein